ncbi:MAG TPA: tyrosine-type recombinase/integrase [Candidatus Melainabacteria bacterium]|nr:tyrosine-type recombinase/integrase [Candidatus Melainabacteria bacterium]
MKSLQRHLNDYLLMRRALGFVLKRQGKALVNFVSFMEQSQAKHISIELALKWAQQPSSAKPATWAARLGYVRGFAQYIRAFDPRTEIPPEKLLPHQPKRAQPYIYSQREIKALMAAALKLPLCCTFTEGSLLKRQTYYVLIGLLAVTGMRISEATNLKIRNVDLRRGVITIEKGKLGKSRLLPLHASTVKVLAKYLELRGQYSQGNSSELLFINRVGKQLDQGTIRRTFYALSWSAGLRRKRVCATGKFTGPRIHDLRHQFAVQTLLRWYQKGEDAEQKLPMLSTYMGHVHVSDTYWYLTSYPELMRRGVDRLEKRWEASL